MIPPADDSAFLASFLKGVGEFDLNPHPSLPRNLSFITISMLPVFLGRFAPFVEESIPRDFFKRVRTPRGTECDDEGDRLRATLFRSMKTATGGEVAGEEFEEGLPSPISFPMIKIDLDPFVDLAKPLKVNRLFQQIDDPKRDRCRLFREGFRRGGLGNDCPGRYGPVFLKGVRNGL